MKYSILLGSALILAGCAADISEAEKSAPGQQGSEAASAATPEPVVPPEFTPVQSDLFGIVGSLSNAWADVDSDGDLDYAVSLKGGAIQLYLQEDGLFVDVTGAYGLPPFDPDAPPPSAEDYRREDYEEFRSLSFSDFDADGYVDLYAGATMPGQDSHLYRNVGGESFVDVAAAAGLTFPGRSSRQNNWVDFDADGDLDLYAVDRIAENKLFENEDGVFEQVFADGGPTDSRATVGACWFDYNQDGRLDLFLANQSGATDALWRNDGDTFTDVAAEAGVDSAGREEGEGGVGCAIGDYDNDGDFDIFLAAYGPNRLYRNEANGTFTDVSETAGISEPDHVVGADWGDFDNDGDLDLFVVGYEGPFGEQTPLNKLYVNDGSGGFENILTLDSPLNAADHGVVWVDYDKDGDLDLSVTDGYGPEGGHFVFRNDMEASLAGHALEMMVVTGEGAVAVPGAEVRLFNAAGDLLASRLITSGGGYNAQSVIPVHFGLPSETVVDAEVTYFTPSGAANQRLDNVDVSQWQGKVLKIEVPAGD